MKEFIENLIGRLEEYKKQWIDADYLDGIDEIIEIVNQLAEEYNGGWISCSERMPEPGKRYLVSGVWKDKDFEKHSVYDAVYGTDKIWHTYEYKPTMYEVIAWQPLPPAWKGESNGQN